VLDGSVPPPPSPPLVPPNGTGPDLPPLLWARIRAILCLTLLSIACEVPDSVGCFELLGYDIIVDQSLKPWLLEVSPTGSTACLVCRCR
jgi:hypothetical protein